MKQKDREREDIEEEELSRPEGREREGEKEILIFIEKETKNSVPKTTLTDNSNLSKAHVINKPTNP